MKVTKKIETILNDLITRNDWKSGDNFSKLFNDGVFENLYKKEFENRRPDACTLETCVLGYNDEYKFTLHAYIHEDYYKWINFFVAVFDNGHVVFGDFEKVVLASNKKHYDIFVKSIENKIKHWSYYDI